MIRKFLATLLGLLVGFVLVLVLEMAGHLVHPPPAGMDFRDEAAVNAYIAQAPFGAMALVVAAWLVGALGGSFVAARVARVRAPGWVVTALVLGATIANLTAYSHPTWMAVAGPLLVIAGGVAGTALGACRSGAAAEEAPAA